MNPFELEDELMCANTWICDSCGETISRPEDGWVEWIMYRNNEGERRARDLRIVHHCTAKDGCQFNESEEFAKDGGLVNDMSLTSFIGDDGLMHLLRYLLQERFVQPDIIELIKRIHISGYEHTRLHLHQAVSEGVFEPNTEVGFPFQYQIDLVQKWIDNE